MHKTGVTLIWLPWSGKTTLSKAVIEKLPEWHIHDHDDDGLESTYGLGKWWIARYIEEYGDSAFLRYEEDFTLAHYGNREEWKTFHFDTMLFSSSGSIILSEAAIEHVRKRTHTILIDIPRCVVLRQIQERDDGTERIVGMHGGPNEKPRSYSLEEELIFRESLYKKYADVSLRYHPWESLEITSDRLHRIIQNLGVL